MKKEEYSVDFCIQWREHRKSCFAFLIFLFYFLKNVAEAKKKQELDKEEEGSWHM